MRRFLFVICLFAICLAVALSAPIVSEGADRNESIDHPWALEYTCTLD
jgi:hypothetical protein